MSNEPEAFSVQRSVIGDDLGATGLPVPAQSSKLKAQSSPAYCQQTQLPSGRWQCPACGTEAPVQSRAICTAAPGYAPPVPRPSPIAGAERGLAALMIASIRAAYPDYPLSDEAIRERMKRCSGELGVGSGELRETSPTQSSRPGTDAKRWSAHSCPECDATAGCRHHGCTTWNWWRDRIALDGCWKWLEIKAFSEEAISNQPAKS